MPPVRNFASVKAVKTERTHEENQERAYIAASRRSDRSLEARIESARRASEIHKKRTGRALRVTEQDVLNEEMYEEEDEDLPSQYRRLTAHLQTGSMDFNRRYQAYMQSQIGTRMAMAASASYDPAFANGGFVQQPYSIPPAFVQQPYMQMVPTHMISPQMAPQPAQLYRHSPYPTASQQYAPSNHQRSASIASPLGIHAPAGYSPSPFPSPSLPRQDNQRRMSLPASQHAQLPSPLTTPLVRPEMSRAPSAVHGAGESSPNASSPTSMTSSVANQSLDRPNFSAVFTNPAHEFGEMNTSPFSFALPPESQMALGSHIDQSGFPAAMLMAGSELLPQQNFYSYNPNSAPKSKASQTPTTSMHTASATNPTLLDTSVDALSYQDLPSATSTSSGGLAPFYDFSTTSSDPFGPEHARPLKSRNNSSQGSDWEDAFLDYGGSAYNT